MKSPNSVMWTQVPFLRLESEFWGEVLSQGRLPSVVPRPQLHVPEGHLGRTAVMVKDGTLAVPDLSWPEL